MWRSPLLPIAEWMKDAFLFTLTGEYYNNIWYPALGLLAFALLLALAPKGEKDWNWVTPTQLFCVLVGLGLMLGPLSALALMLMASVVLIPLELLIMVFDPSAHESLGFTLFFAFLCLGPLLGGGGYVIVIIFRR